MKKIFNYIMLAAVALSGVTLTGCSKDDLDTNQYNKSGVNILAFGPMPVTRGEKMRLTGTQLDKVKEVLFPEGNQKLKPSKTYIKGEFERSSSTEMTVTIPDMCVPGKLRLVTNDNDTIVSVTNISFTEEIKVASFTPDKVHAGDTVTIAGEFVWNIAQVVFSSNVKVDAEDFVTNTRKEVKLLVPYAAVSGPVTCNDGSESSESIVLSEHLTVDIALATRISNPTPEFNEQVTIYGENLDLIEKVAFPAVGEVEFIPTKDGGKTLVVTVPETCVSGEIVLTSYSGMATSVEFAVPLATYTSISPDKDLKVGDEVTIAGALLNRIVQIDLPGDITLAKGEFTQTESTIKFTVPEGMGDGPVTMVQHKNYSVVTTKISVYHESGDELVIWQGKRTIGGWDGAMDVLAWGGYDWASVAPGQVLSVYITPNMQGDYGPQIRLGNGSWNALPSTTGWGPEGNLNLTADDNVVRVKLSENDINVLVNEGGLVVCGAWFTVTKITLSTPEKELWSGTLIADDWANQPYVLSDAGQELKDANAQPGQAVNFYIEPIEPEWKLEIVEGHWGPSYGAWCAPGADTEGGKFTEYDLGANGGKITIYLTQAMLDAAYTQQWWGGVFVLNGDNVKCTKVTLK